MCWTYVDDTCHFYSVNNQVACFPSTIAWWLVELGREGRGDRVSETVGNSASDTLHGIGMQRCPGAHSLTWVSLFRPLLVKEFSTFLRPYRAATARRFGKRLHACWAQAMWLIWDTIARSLAVHCWLDAAYNYGTCWVEESGKAPVSLSGNRLVLKTVNLLARIKNSCYILLDSFHSVWG